MSKSKKIILGVSGSIAAYKSADVLRRLADLNYHLSVVMTPEATRFITPLTLGSLCEGRVYSDMFDESAWQMRHISLANEADIFLIVPSTANIISKIANGLADDFITCIALATSARMIFAPAMNEQMFKNKILQENIERLKKNGSIFVAPVEGNLACGVFGEGHLADVEDIVSAVVQLR